MKKAWLILTLIIFSSLVSAISPFTPQTTTGFSIEPVNVEYIKELTNYNFHIHVINQSNGLPLNTGISCYMHLYNSTGDHLVIMEQDTPEDIFDYTFSVNGDNFILGNYFAKFQCNDSIRGGSIEIGFKVTKTGNEQTTAQGLGSSIFIILFIALTCLFGYIGFKLITSPYLWVLGIFFLFLSVLLIVYDTYLGYEYHLLLTGMPNSDTPQIIFYIFMILLLAGILTSLALLFLNWKKVFRYIKREIKRKEESYDDVEDWDYEGWAGNHRLNGGHFQPR